MYKHNTQRILDELSSNVIAGVLEFISLSEQDIDHLTWEDVRLVDTFIHLTGVVSYEIGETYKNDTGKEFIVDQSNVVDASKLVNIVVPVSLAEQGSKDEVVKFLHQLAAEQELDFQDTRYDDINDDINDQLDQDVSQEQWIRDFFANYIQDEVQFDLGKLTEEQQKALHRSYTMSTDKGKIH